MLLPIFCCPSSTCRVNFYKTDICPVNLIPESLGVVEKPKNPVLLGAESYLGKVVRAAFPRYFRSPFQSGPIPFLPLFFGGILGLPRTILSSAASLDLFWVLYYWAWAVAFFSLGLGLPMSEWAWPVSYWAPQLLSLISKLILYYLL